AWPGARRRPRARAPARSAAPGRIARRPDERLLAARPPARQGARPRAGARQPRARRGACRGAAVHRRRRPPRRYGMTRPSAPAGAGPVWLATLLALALGAALPGAGCIVRRFTGPDLTGTCDGACAHYVQCKPGHAKADGDRCLAECPGVFSDRDSLMT